MKKMHNIRSYFDKYLKDNGYKLQQFSEIVDINVGTLSAIIRGTRLISMNQLDRITSAMGLEQGCFYDMYGVEYFIESAPHWRRLEPFIYRCAELGKLDVIQQVITHVTDDHSYIDELFEIAEELYNKGMKQAALILYECVSECEKYQHSERLAMCQYRIFLISINLKKFDNLNAAIRLEVYVEKLNEEVQLDAIKELANVYSTMHLWEKVYSLAEELERKSDALLRFKSRGRTKRITDYPLITYKAYAILLKASVFKERKEYAMALKYTDIYERIVDISDPSEEEGVITAKFKRWAQGNRITINLMSGNQEFIHEYLNYLEAYSEETLTAFINIIEVANEQSLKIEFDLEEYEDKIKRFYLDRGCNSRIITHRYMLFNYELAKYKCNRQEYQNGIDIILYNLSLSTLNQDDHMTVKCVDLYGTYRQQASLSQQETYSQLFKTINIK
ncbi:MULTISPECIES: helix-turn-helix domain-containing protein [Paenibacillus]|uniref:helix-turn-helix domain-containing protein n=1 Tax=Paenibacillus TaxID=44249 RepID=UPI000B89FFD2|nr:helix-turn-helix transcriptional regulator [Paenibacillus amylolyticus]